MDDRYITFLIIINFVLIALFIMHMWNCDHNQPRVEGLDNITVQPEIEIDSNSNEGVQNVSSIYDGKMLIVDNLKVTGQLEVNGTTQFKSNVKADNDLVVGNRLDVENYAKFGKTAVIDARPGAQDKLMLYKNGNGKPPYLYYNKQGDLGVWKPNNSQWQMTNNGRVYGKSLKIDSGDISLAGSAPIMKNWPYTLETANNPCHANQFQLAYNCDGVIRQRHHSNTYNFQYRLT
jgi:hypothetical protein